MHKDICGYPQLSDSQFNRAVSIGKELRSRYPVDGLDEVALKKVLGRANHEFSRRVEGGSVIFVNGQMNFLHYNNMLKIR